MKIDKIKYNNNTHSSQPALNIPPDEFNSFFIESIGK